jgi:hypothetical protein
MKLKQLLDKYYAALAKLPKDWEKVASGEIPVPDDPSDRRGAQPGGSRKEPSGF